jgi:26S proteasome regulatory subunit N8
VTNQIASLRGLHSRLVEIRDYLALVGKGKLPVNHAIMYNLQDIFNLLPNLDDASGAGVGLSNGLSDEGTGEAKSQRIAKAFRVETNDQLLVVYLSSLIRSVLALHDLSELEWVVGDGNVILNPSCLLATVENRLSNS